MKAQVNFDALGGGGGDPNIVTAYENGEWQNGFSASDFNLSTMVEESDCYSSSGGAGYGINLIKDYSSNYSDILIKITTTNTNSGRAFQGGTSALTASLPTIITGGAGRGSYEQYYIKFPSYQTLGFPLSTNYGAFLGESTFGAMPYKIHGIYFVKKSS